MSTTRPARPACTLRNGVERRPARPRRPHVAAPLPEAHAALLTACTMHVRAWWPVVTSMRDLVLVIESRGHEIAIFTQDRDLAGAWLACVATWDEARTCLHQPPQGAATVVVAIDASWRCTTVLAEPERGADA